MAEAQVEFEPGPPDPFVVRALSRPVEEAFPEARGFLAAARERTAPHRGKSLARLMRSRVVKSTAFMARLVALQGDAQAVLERLAQHKPQAYVSFVSSIFGRCFDQSMLLQRVQMQGIIFAEGLVREAEGDAALADALRVFLDSVVSSLRLQTTCVEYWTACFRDQDIDLAHIPSPLPSLLPRAVPADSGSPILRRFSLVRDAVWWLNVSLLFGRADRPSEVTLWDLFSRRLAANVACGAYLLLRQLSPKYRLYRTFNFANMDLQPIVDFFDLLLVHARASDSNQVKAAMLDLLSVLCALPPGEPQFLLQRLRPGDPGVGQTPFVRVPSAHAACAA
eukprot:tig00020816_g14096.t1